MRTVNRAVDVDDAASPGIEPFSVGGCVDELRLVPETLPADGVVGGCCSECADAGFGVKEGWSKGSVDGEEWILGEIGEGYLVELLLRSHLDGVRMTMSSPIDNRW